MTNTFDARLATMSPAEAWQGFVGSQTPQEFMTGRNGPDAMGYAAIDYANDLPNMFPVEYSNLTPTQRGRIADLLYLYLKENLM